jgi:hypothetical protein
MADSFDDRLNAFTPIICIRNKKKKKSPVGDRVRAGQTKKNESRKLNTFVNNLQRLIQYKNFDYQLFNIFVISVEYTLDNVQYIFYVFLFHECN